MRFIQVIIETNEVCGDGKVIGLESCDDWSDDDLGCNSDCSGPHPAFTCTGGDVNSPSVCKPICGDGLVYFPEVCDDGIQPANLKGCDYSCSSNKTGWSCTAGSNTVGSFCTPICGDGLLLGNEECDDLNLDGSDGCSPTCEIETYWECDGNSPSICKPVCGDGK